ncbi:GntR family transcriptional regulator [Compostimonas suwonensis]|uniref:DNA-binding GntR family transcriptional regulator n=1 Tax=Compostimonas suwonensis TaxID=1048394 RepID=A0A2M9BWV6_9MICO|nr:GntR family transcriptional regulator [Compostimonas suwonensis]PJJ62414.1 DNA-binding GntR family transcriptional regulator [Compostimonas suwonensis]
MPIKTEREESSYRALARSLREALVRGDYADGRALPTEASLAQTHGIARQTVRQAFHELVSEGLVYRVRGRGTFAAPQDGAYIMQLGTIDDLMGLAVDTVLEVVEPLRRQVDVEAASRLQLSQDTVSCLVFRRLHDEVPFCLTTVYLPPDVGALLAEYDEFGEAGSSSRSTIIGILDQRLESPVAETQQSITVALADEATALHLACEVGDPLLRIDRVHKDLQGRAVELAINYFLPSQYSYRTQLRRRATM